MLKINGSYSKNINIDVSCWWEANSYNKLDKLFGKIYGSKMFSYLMTQYYCF